MRCQTIGFCVAENDRGFDLWEQCIDAFNVYVLFL